MNDTALLYKESNTSSAWYLQFYSFLMSTGLWIKNILLMVPDVFYPDNPAQDSFFPFLNVARWLTIFSYLTPISVILNITSTWKSIKKFYYEENKNLEKTLDLGVKVSTTAAATTFLGLMLFGSAALVLSVAPYLLLAAAGVGVLYGLFNIGKHIYRAIKTDDKEKRKVHGMAIGKQIVSTVVNALAFTVTFFIGVKINAQFGQLSGEIFHDLGIIQNVGTIFKAAIPFVYALAACITLGAIPSVTKSAWDMNKETLQTAENLITKPKETIKNAAQAFTAKWQNLWGFIKKTHYIALPIIFIPIALETVSVAVNLVCRVAALSIMPFQALILGVRQCLGKNKSVAAPQAEGRNESAKKVFTQLGSTAKPSSPELQATLVVDHKATAKDEKIVSEYDELHTVLVKKISLLEKYGTEIGKKDAAKLGLLKDIRQHLESQDITLPMIDGFIAKAKIISCRVFQSFWRGVGEVEEIVKATKHYVLNKITNRTVSPEKNENLQSMLVVS